MSVDYNFYLRVGFSLKKEDVEKPYLIKIEEKFHYEDRFDSKTGLKLKPVQIIDQYEGTELNIKINGKLFEEDLFCLIYETNYFQSIFDCKVSQPFGTNVVNFYLEPPNSKNNEHGAHISIYSGSIPFSWIEKNKERFEILKNKLKETFGLDPGEPCVFIEENIG